MSGCTLSPFTAVLCEVLLRPVELLVVHGGEFYYDSHPNKSTIKAYHICTYMTRQSLSVNKGFNDKRLILSVIKL